MKKLHFRPGVKCCSSTTFLLGSGGHFHDFREFHLKSLNPLKSHFYVKSANSTKIAKLAIFSKVCYLFRNITISEGQNVVLEQHSQPGA